MDPAPVRLGRILSDSLPGLLRHQLPDGSFDYQGRVPVVYPQMAIHPLAWLWAGSPDPAQRRSPQVLDAVRRLGGFLLARHGEDGTIAFDSNGIPVHGVERRLILAWTEALHLLRQAGADVDQDGWSRRIARACETMIAHRLGRLAGLSRFIGRSLGCGTNHVSLELATVYRAGMVLGRPDLCELVLPVARGFAADVNPDGYWEEHSDIDRLGGPTPSYNYLTLCGVGLLHAWTGDPALRTAIEANVAFYSRFCLPDSTVIDLFDERVRSAVPRPGRLPSIWGLFAMTATPVGRGVAEAHLRTWEAAQGPAGGILPETLARCCENADHWRTGPVADVPYEGPDHRARLQLPAGIRRCQGWSIAVSAMPAATAADPAYRDNPFALDREKLFSVWHPATGLLLDGSHSKGQRENATFCAEVCNCVGDTPVFDFLPQGGAIAIDGAPEVTARYRSFIGRVQLLPVSERELRIVFSVEPLAVPGAIRIGFTIVPPGDSLVLADGRAMPLAGAPAALPPAEVQGGFAIGRLAVQGPADTRVHWPLDPFNPYTAGNKAWAHDLQVRVAAELDRARPRAEFILRLG